VRKKRLAAHILYLEDMTGVSINKGSLKEWARFREDARGGNEHPNKQVHQGGTIYGGGGGQGRAGRGSVATRSIQRNKDEVSSATPKKRKQGWYRCARPACLRGHFGGIGRIPTRLPKVRCFRDGNRCPLVGGSTTSNLQIKGKTDRPGRQSIIGESSHHQNWRGRKTTGGAEVGVPILSFTVMTAGDVSTQREVTTSQI